MKGDALPYCLPGPTEGHLTAWRLWYLGRRDSPVLTSLAKPIVWEPGEPMRHSAAKELGLWFENDFGYGPGVYGAKTLDVLTCTSYDTVTELLRGTYALGEVALWGKIIEHRHGYRAEYGYPHRLVVLAKNDLMERVGERYGCQLVPPSQEVMRWLVDGQCKAPPPVSMVQWGQVQNASSFTPGPGLVSPLAGMSAVSPGLALLNMTTAQQMQLQQAAGLQRLAATQSSLARSVLARQAALSQYLTAYRQQQIAGQSIFGQPPDLEPDEPIPPLTLKDVLRRVYEIAMGNW